MEAMRHSPNFILSGRLDVIIRNGFKLLRPFAISSLLPGLAYFSRLISMRRLVNGRLASGPIFQCMYN